MIKYLHRLFSVKSCYYLLYALPVLESYNRTYVVYLLSFTAFLILFFSISKRIVIEYKLAFFGILFLLISLISSIFSISLISSLNELLLYFDVIVLFVLFFNEPRSFQERYLKYFIFSNLLILSILFLLTQTHITAIIPGNTLNLFYPYFGHNKLSSWLIFSLPISLLELKSSNTAYKKYFWITLSFYQMLLLILSMGRGAMIFLCLAFLIHIFLKRNYRKYQDKSILWIIILCINSIIFILLSFIYSNFAGAGYYKEAKGLYKPAIQEYRLVYFNQAWQAFKYNFQVGTGLDTFKYVSLKTQANPGENSLYPHNHYLEIFQSIGFAGGFVFLLLIVVLVHNTLVIVLQNPKFMFTDGIAIALLASSLHSTIDYNWHIISVFTLVFLSFSFVSTYIVEEKVIIGLPYKLFSIFILSISFLIPKNTSDFLNDIVILKDWKNNAYVIKKLLTAHDIDKSNFQIAAAIAQYYEENNHLNFANKWYEESIKLNPYGAGIQFNSLFSNYIIQIVDSLYQGKYDDAKYRIDYFKLSGKQIFNKSLIMDLAEIKKSVDGSDSERAVSQLRSLVKRYNFHSLFSKASPSQKNLFLAGISKN